jgi:hypothetical protein
VQVAVEKVRQASDVFFVIPTQIGRIFRPDRDGLAGFEDQWSENCRKEFL